MADRPDIFRYHHYRKFLTDWLDYLKSSNEKFSLRSLAKQAGLSSAYLPYVLSGSRRMSPNAFKKLSPHLQLPKNESAYFAALVDLAEADTPQLRLEAMQRIRRFRNYQQANPDENRVFQYLTRWIHVAIREMAMLPDFKLEPEWIHSKLCGEVSLDETRRAIDFLQKQGFLKLTPDGSVIPPKTQIRCEGTVYGLALRHFHNEMNSVLFKSIEQVPADQHVVGGHTLAIPKDRFGEVRKILEEALQKIEKLPHGGKDADTVFHVALVGAPISRPSGGK